MKKRILKLPKELKCWRNSDPETTGLIKGYNLALQEIKKLNKIKRDKK